MHPVPVPARKKGMGLLPLGPPQIEERLATEDEETWFYRVKHRNDKMEIENWEASKTLQEEYFKAVSKYHELHAEKQQEANDIATATMIMKRYDRDNVVLMKRSGIHREPGDESDENFAEEEEDEELPPEEEEEEEEVSEPEEEEEEEENLQEEEEDDDDELEQAWGATSSSD